MSYKQNKSPCTNRSGKPYGIKERYQKEQRKRRKQRNYRVKATKSEDLTTPCFAKASAKLIAARPTC